jgi:hypothetical protein
MHRLNLTIDEALYEKDILSILKNDDFLSQDEFAKKFNL